MSTADTLRQARRLIRNPKHWTRGTYQYRVNRRILPNYYQFCLVGAIAKVASGDAHGLFDDATEEALRPVRAVLGLTTFMSVVDWNDRHKHADVLALLDAAIKEAESYER